MIHRALFQPLPFCDSMWFCDYYWLSGKLVWLWNLRYRLETVCCINCVIVDFPKSWASPVISKYINETSVLYQTIRRDESMFLFWGLSCQIHNCRTKMGSGFVLLPWYRISVHWTLPLERVVLPFCTFRNKQITEICTFNIDRTWEWFFL